MQTFEVNLAEWSKEVERLAQLSRMSDEDFIKRRAAGLLYQIKRDCPFRTGALQGSFTAAKEGLGKMARFSIAKNKKFANKGFYREQKTSSSFGLSFGTSVKYGYVLNAGYRYSRKGKRTDYPQHKGWFDNAIAKETEWTANQYMKELKKRANKWVV